MRLHSFDAVSHIGLGFRSGSTAVTGVGTLFTSQLAVGDVLIADNRTLGVVQTIINDTQLTLSGLAGASVSGSAFRSGASQVSFSAFYAGTSVFVSQWFDQSGFNRHLRQLVNADQPRIVLNGTPETQNGRFVIRQGDGGARFLLTEKRANWFDNSTYTLSKVTAEVSLSPSNMNAVSTWGGNGPNSRVLHHGYRNNNQLTLAHYGNDVNFNALSTTDLEAHTSIYTQPGSRMYRNSSILGTSSNAPNASLTTPGHLSLGFYRPTGTAYNGFFAEFLSFNTILSDADRVAMEESQLQYYGIDRSVWTGAIDTDWTKAGNWQGNVPNATTPTVVIIPNTPNKPIISTTVDARSVTIENGSTLTISSTGNLRLNGILTSPTSGIIANQGSIEFNQHPIGITLQANVFQGNQLGRLRVNTTNNLTIQDNLIINNELRISNGFFVSSGQTLTINGKITNDILNRFRGNNNLNLVLNCNEDVVLSLQQGSSNNAVRSLLINTTNFSVTLNGDVQLTNEFLNIQSGTLNTNGFAIDRTSAGGTLTVAAAGTLQIGGTSTIPANFNTHVFAAGSTVHYSGSNQSVASLNSGQSYSNLILSGSGIKTFAAGFSIGSALTLNPSTKASLNGFTSTVPILTLDNNPQASGSYGGTGSGAANINTAFFEDGTGILNVTSNTYTWVGNVSNDWYTAGNWSSGFVPSIANNVIIPSVTAPNQAPVITNSAEANSVNLSSGANVTNNGTLTIAGDWTNTSATISGNGNYNFTGQNKLISGSANAFGNLNIQNGATITLANTGHTAQNLNIQGTSNTTTFTHQGAASLTVSGNVIVEQPTADVANRWNINAGTAIVNGNITYQGSSTFTGRVQEIVLTDGSLRIDGDLTFSNVNNTSRRIITSGGASTIRLRGNLNLDGTQTLTAGTAGATFIYEGTSAQTVNFFSSGGYHHLTLANAVSATLNSFINTGRVSGNLVFASPVVNNNGHSITGNSNRIFRIQQGTTFNLTGSSSFPSGYGTVDIEQNTLVRYNSSNAQTIAAANYYDIEVSGNRGANNVTLASSGIIDIRNTVVSTSTFTSGTFVTTGSTVRYSKGTGDQDVVNFNYNNLTLANGAQKYALGDITVNGVLDLGPNPGPDRGHLEMTIDYTHYATSRYSTDSNGNPIADFANFDNDPLNTNSTSVRNNLNSYVLTMGPNATTTGSGDVTGKIRRTSFVDNVAYTFGNQNTRITFSGGGTLPSQMTVVATRGAHGLHVDKTNAVRRLFQILRTGGTAPKLITLRLPYSDSELNGNPSESNLVLWDHHIPYNGPTPHEHGKTNNSTSQNWVELTGHGITYLDPEGATDRTKYWMMSDKISTTKEWLGAVSSNWDLVANWNGAVPTAGESVVIGTSSPNALLIDGSRSLGTIEIRNGVTVNTAAGATLTLTGGPAINGGAGSWNNQGSFNAGNSTVVFTAATATMSGLTNFYNVTVNNGSTLTMQSGSQMGIANTFTQNGVLDATTNTTTISLNGSNQNVFNPTGGQGGFHNLVIGQVSGNASLIGNTTVRGQLALNQGNLMVGSNTLTLRGPYISGNLGLLNTTSSSNLVFENNAAETSAVNFPPILAVNNLTINSPAGIEYILPNALPITGNLSISSGSLNLNGFTANRASAGGSISLTGTGGLIIGGTEAFPTNYSSKTIGSSSTVHYNGGIQSVDGVTQGTIFGNLILTGDDKSFLSNAAIAGNFSVADTTAVTLPTLMTFNGAQTQLISGLPYTNVHFEGDGTKSFTSNGQINSNGRMSFGAGNGAVDFDGPSNTTVFTFKSDATSTAIIGNSGSFALNGNVTTERYTKAKRAFRFFAPAVTTSTSINANWQEGAANTATGNANNIDPVPNFGTHITGSGGAANGFDATATNNPSMFGWNNNTQAWTTVTSTLSNTFAAGTPYRILVRGDRRPGLLLNGATPFPTTLRARGTMVKTYSASANTNGGNNQYIFVGNPYQSIVDLQKVLDDYSTNVNANFAYFWDHNINNSGAYVTVTFPSNDALRYMQPGQSVFIQMIDGESSGEVSIPESTKVLQATNEAPLSTTDFASLRIQLHDANEFALQGRELDNLLIRFSDFWENEVDAFDASKFANPDEELSVMNATKSLTVESRSWPTAQDVLPLRLNKYRRQNYLLTAHINEIPGIQTFLHDQFLNTFTEIVPGALLQYPFEVSAGVPASIATDRFRIVFEEEALSNNPINNLPKVSLYPNPTDGEATLSLPIHENSKVEVHSLIGQLILSEDTSGLSSYKIKLDSATSDGVYLVRVTINNSTQTHKLVLKR